MAKLSDLIRTVAAATGEAESSVNVIARNLREHGLIATGGRGRQAATMSAADAASLLLGVGAPGDHTKAADTVEALEGIGLDHVVRWRTDPSNERVSRLIRLPPDLYFRPGDTLRTTLTALLDHYAAPTPQDIGDRASTFGSPDLNALDANSPPCAITIDTSTGPGDWRATLRIRTISGARFDLYFVPTQTNRAPTRRGKYASTMLGKSVCNAVIRCLRDEPAEPAQELDGDFDW